MKVRMPSLPRVPVVTHSLRGRLLWFLLAAITMAAIAQAMIAYRSALSDADQIFDYHMQQMAMSLRSSATLTNKAADTAADPENDDLVVQVWTPDGAQVFRSLSRAALPQRAVLGFSNVKANNTTYRIFSVQTSNQTVQVAQDMAVRQRMAGTLALRTVGPIAVMAPVLMLVVWWVVSGSLAPVSRVKRQVAARQADDLSPVSENDLPDEVLPLVHELNLLFGRVRTAFQAQQHFVADAAHELRTPLAALKLQVLSLERAQDEAARSVAIARDGRHRTGHAAGRAVAGAGAAGRFGRRRQARTGQPERPGQAHAGRHGRPGAGAPDRPGPASCRRGVTVDGQPDALIILLRNLIDNAIKYTPAGGTVDIDLRRSVGATKAAAGRHRAQRRGFRPRHPPEERERVFSRFYRVPGSPAGGSGLGMAIVKSIAERHGAVLTLDQSERLGGLKVKVDFPETARATPV
jgi:two-component system OmpR family sensor kinase